LRNQGSDGVKAIRLGKGGFKRRWSAIYRKSLEGELLELFLSRLRWSAGVSMQIPL
jgi:hypothetical protein